jgi:hypothetical protein
MSYGVDYRFDGNFAGKDKGWQQDIHSFATRKEAWSFSDTLMNNPSTKIFGVRVMPRGGATNARLANERLVRFLPNIQAVETVKKDLRKKRVRRSKD